MNPVAIALFFKATCTGIFKYLLVAESSKKGLFGPVSTYYETVKTNS